MNNIKLRHQAPKGQRTNSFNSIEIEGNFAYCKSHHFIYNTKKEEELLYKGLPCYYTDKRFADGKFNYFKNTKVFWKKFNPISLKSCIRKTLNCKNIPIGTIVEFKTSWYYPGKKINTSYLFKVKKENSLTLNYEVSKPSFFKNFNNCDFSKSLTDELRKNGFLVQVWNTNPDFLIGEDDGEFAIAYGFGKKVGFSSKNNSFRGYSCGVENILWDNFGEFDKWSRCNQISKDTNINEILDILKL